MRVLCVFVACLAATSGTAAAQSFPVPPFTRDVRVVKEGVAHSVALVYCRFTRSALGHCFRSWRTRPRA